MEQKNIVGKRDIGLSLIDNFPNYPYHIFDDADMSELVESILTYSPPTAEVKEYIITRVY